MVENSLYWLLMCMLDDVTLLIFIYVYNVLNLMYLCFLFFKRLFQPHHMRAENTGLSLSPQRRVSYSALQESVLAGSQSLVGSWGYSWHRQTTKGTRTPQTQMGRRPLAHLAPFTTTLLKKRSGTAWGKPWSDIETMSKSPYLKERATDCRRNGGRRSSLCFMPFWTWFWPRLWSQWFMREYHPRRTAHRCRISSLTI